MALNISGITVAGVTMGLYTPPSTNIGTPGASSTPPGPIKLPTNLTFTQTSPPPGPFEFSGEFNGNVGTILDGLPVDTYTAALNYPTGYVWQESTQTNTLDGTGNAVALVNTFTNVNAPGQEFNMPNGLFIEYMFSAVGTDVFADSGLVIGLNLGFTGVSIVAGNQYYQQGKIRVDVDGFNGYTNPDGTLLPADPNDPYGLTSQSYSETRVYSNDVADWSNKVIRLEVTPTHFTVYVDSVVVISFDSIIHIDMFASSSYKSADTLTSYSSDFSNLTFGGFGGSTVNVNYIRVGAL